MRIPFAPISLSLLLLPLGVSALTSPLFASDGELLLGEYGCVSCHEVSDSVHGRISPKRAPKLDRVGARVAPDYLRRFLEAPHEMKPGTTMPDLLGGLSDSDRADAIDALVHYLVSRGGPIAAEPARVRSAGDVEVGRRLFHESGCVACHAPQETQAQLEVPWHEVDDWIWDEVEPDEDLWIPEGVVDPPALELGELTTKTTVDELTAFLLNPLETRPSGRMPAMRLSASEARAIALYLLRDQAFAPGRVPSPSDGLAYEYFAVGGHGPYAKVDGREPDRTGSIFDLAKLPEHRPDHFAFRYTGDINVPREGEYTFSTTSDDGSRLWIDGELVVNNDGNHGPTKRSGSIDLREGAHSIEVTFYEAGGGEDLEVRWKGPGIEEEIIPAENLSHRTYSYQLETSFEVDPQRVREGEEWFERLACAGCHEPRGERAHRIDLPSLDRLDANAAGGCLSESQSERVPA